MMKLLLLERMPPGHLRPANREGAAVPLQVNVGGRTPGPLTGNDCRLPWSVLHTAPAVWRRTS